MRTGRFALAALLLPLSMEAATPNSCLAQQRPGIRTFVNTPEGCYITEAPDVESLNSFTKMQIQALWLASRGEQALQELLTLRGDALSQIALMIPDLRKERIDIICAAFLLSPFSESKNLDTSIASRILVLGYQQLGDMTDDMLGIVLKGGSGRHPETTWTQISDWKRKRQDTLAKMAATTNSSISLLLDAKRIDSKGQPDHLLLTPKERDDLLDELHTKFPSLHSKNPSGRTDAFIEQAGAIEAILTGYKAKDVR